MDHLAKYANYDTEDPRFKDLLDSNATKQNEVNAEKELSNVGQLPSHAQASTTPVPSKGISIDKLADLRSGYDFISKKSTIDLPKGTSPALAGSLADLIRRRLGEGEREEHGIRVIKRGSHYQIRFRTGKGGVGPESIQGFVRRLITGCKDLGIEDEAALARFMRKCPMLASAFGDGRIWFRYGPTIASVMTSHEDEACVREALKQKNFSFIGLFLPCLREHQSAAYEVAVSATFKDAQENIAAKSPIAIRLAKHAMNTIEFMDLRDGYRFEQNMTHELTGSEDAKEAARAFVEKRKPVFKGR